MATFDRKSETWCYGCQKAKSFTSFYQSLNPNHNNYLPLCKTCLNVKFREYTKKIGNESAALYCLCAEMGYPMLKQVYDILIKQVNEPEAPKNWFVSYHLIMRDLGIQFEGFWESDISITDFIDINNQQENKDEIKIADIPKLEAKWGKFELEDYQLLEDFYDMYTKDLHDMQPALKMRYCDLCKAELRKRKADENGDITEIGKAEDSIRKIMALLKLDDFETNKKSDTDRFIDKLIWKIEETEPAEEEDKEKYADIAGYEKIYDSFMRSMRNTIAGTKNYPDVPKEEM